MKLNKKWMKYFDRQRQGKPADEIGVYDFVVRLLGFVAFGIIVLAIIAGIIYFLFIQ